MEKDLGSLQAYVGHDYTCHGLLHSRAYRLNHRHAVIFNDRVWSWNALLEGVERFARFFVARGVKAGDRVAIIATNSDYYAIAFLAISRIGAATVTINCELDATEIQAILVKSRPKLVLVSGDRLDKIPDVEFILLESEENGEIDLWKLSEGADAELPPRPDPVSTCLIMFTSGTTGRPKGVMHSQRNFVLSGEGFVGRMALSAKERVLCVLPLFHINALFYSFAGALASGATVIFERRFSASRFWKTVSTVQATQVNLIAAAGNILLRRDRSEFIPNHQLEKVYLSPLTKSLYEGFRDEFGVTCIREGYGLTEAPGVINQPVDLPPSLGSMGEVSRHPDDGSPLAELRILDDQGEELEVGRPGELWVRSPILMQGYFEDPEATANVLHNGWFRTGDLVWKNSKEEFFFIERIKDIIRRRGENISGAELDAVISGHPNIAQIAVIATPSEFGEDEILAAVVPSKMFTAKSFKEWCKSVLPLHKQPKFISFCEDLPRTPSEKIEKYKVRKDPRIRAAAIDLSKL